jgi:short-subunit dehydrogenase
MEQCPDKSGAAVNIGAFDMRDRAAFGKFLGGFGPVDLYVSSHGVLDGRREGEILESASAAHEVLEINLMASIAGLHDVLNGMLERRQGQIVLVTSLAGLAPLADAPAYSASKAGLVSYGLALREALRGEGIGVSTVCPGYVATPMGDIHLGEKPHELSAKKAARLILKAGLSNRRLTGFPFPLWPMALFSSIMPEAIGRFFTRSLRFAVGK